MGTNVFLEWAQQYAKSINTDACWICGQLPTSSAPALRSWVSPLQGDDWIKLQNYRIATKHSDNLKLATRSNVAQRPISETFHQKGQGKNFSLATVNIQLWKYRGLDLFHSPKTLMMEDNH